MIQNSLYHSLLRISAVVCALILVFDSGALVPSSASLSDSTQLYLGSVIGVTAGVEPTELNLITAELTKKETELVAREQALVDREIAIQRNPAVTSAPESDYSTFILSLILFILLTLIVMNYGLDYARSRRLELQYAQGT